MPSFLLAVALSRSVFMWGPPGIGKSSVVQEFSDELGMECVTLLGTQLAPEDLMGVPTVVNGKTRFQPPELIARDKPYVLFCDELNGSSNDVQKAFYSLILDHRLGDFVLPEGSIVICAGNRSTDSAIVRQMSSALINRVVHVELRASYKDWMDWAVKNDIHPLVLDYLQVRPAQLASLPPKIEQPFSTPRSWHMLSDALKAFSEEELTTEMLQVLAYGTLTPEHATQFIGSAKSQDHRTQLARIIKGDETWPQDKANSDQLMFLALALREKLAKELPPTQEKLTDATRQLAQRSKNLIASLASINGELAHTVLAEDQDSNRKLPDWYLVEMTRDIPDLLRLRR